MKFTASVLILLAYGVVCISAQTAEPTPETTGTPEPEQEPEPTGTPEPEQEPEPTAKMGCKAIPAYDHSECANMEIPAECRTMMDCQMAGSVGAMCCETKCGGMKCEAFTAPWPNSSTTLMMSVTLLVVALLLNYLA